MIHSGLVSVTFRALSLGEIVGLVVRAGLEGIEWGGDVHVPHGDVTRTREAYKRTVDAGLAIPSYGSYYRTGQENLPPAKVSFEAVLESALALHAPIVRVWAGRRASADADETYWRRVIEDSLRIAGLAQQAGLSIAYEFHDNTLTDTNASALRLLEAVDHPAISTYWQSRGKENEETRLEGLRAILPRLSHVHVQQADGGGRRTPLAEGAELWVRRLDLVRSTGRSHYALIEFVQDDAPEAFLRDAETLKEWLEATPGDAERTEKRG
jgi:3-dehydroshikimate dehydratase